jgi:hypothetical protein
MRIRIPPSRIFLPCRSASFQATGPCVSPLLQRLEDVFLFRDPQSPGPLPGPQCRLETYCARCASRRCANSAFETGAGILCASADAPRRARSLKSIGLAVAPRSTQRTSADRPRLPNRKRISGKACVSGPPQLGRASGKAFRIPVRAVHAVQSYHPLDI